MFFETSIVEFSLIISDYMIFMMRLYKSEFWNSGSPAVPTIVLQQLEPAQDRQGNLYAYKCGASRP